MEGLNQAGRDPIQGLGFFERCKAAITGPSTKTVSTLFESKVFHFPSESTSTTKTSFLKKLSSSNPEKELSKFLDVVVQNQQFGGAISEASLRGAIEKVEARLEQDPTNKNLLDVGMKLLELQSQKGMILSNGLLSNILNKAEDSKIQKFFVHLNVSYLNDVGSLLVGISDAKKQLINDIKLQKALVVQLAPTNMREITSSKEARKEQNESKVTSKIKEVLISLVDTDTTDTSKVDSFIDQQVSAIKDKSKKMDLGAIIEVQQLETIQSGLEGLKSKKHGDVAAFLGLLLAGMHSGQLVVTEQEQKVLQQLVVKQFKLSGDNPSLEQLRMQLIAKDPALSGGEGNSQFLTDVLRTNVFLSKDREFFQGRKEREDQAAAQESISPDMQGFFTENISPEKQAQFQHFLQQGTAQGLTASVGLLAASKGSGEIFGAKVKPSGFPSVTMTVEGDRLKVQKMACFHPKNQEGEQDTSKVFVGVETMTFDLTQLKDDSKSLEGACLGTTICSGGPFEAESKDGELLFKEPLAVIKELPFAKGCTLKWFTPETTMKVDKEKLQQRAKKLQGELTSEKLLQKVEAQKLFAKDPIVLQEWAKFYRENVDKKMIELLMLKEQGLEIDLNSTISHISEFINSTINTSYEKNYFINLHAIFNGKNLLYTDLQNSKNRGDLYQILSGMESIYRKTEKEVPDDLIQLLLRMESRLPKEHEEYTLAEIIAKAGRGFNVCAVFTDRKVMQNIERREKDGVSYQVVRQYSTDYERNSYYLEKSLVKETRDDTDKLFSLVDQLDGIVDKENLVLQLSGILHQSYSASASKELLIDKDLLEEQEKLGKEGNLTKISTQMTQQGGILVSVENGKLVITSIVEGIVQIPGEKEEKDRFGKKMKVYSTKMVFDLETLKQPGKTLLDAYKGEEEKILGPFIVEETEERRVKENDGKKLFKFRYAKPEKVRKALGDPPWFKDATF